MVETVERAPDLLRRGDKDFRADYLIQRCGVCKSELVVDAGDVLAGGLWYHAACWAQGDEDRRLAQF
jgi:hypothetical protein